MKAGRIVMFMSSSGILLPTWNWRGLHKQVFKKKIRLLFVESDSYRSSKCLDDKILMVLDSNRKTEKTNKLISFNTQTQISGRWNDL